ncbi:phage tail protein [Agrobacterium sp. CG674]
MALPTFEPPIGPSPGTGHKPTVNLWEAEFGDGYSQSTPKGINHIKKSVSLTWDVLTTEQMEEITGFFERMMGNKPFYYKAFGNTSAVKWTCKEWEFDTDEGLWSVKATFIQSFTNQK